MGFFDSDFFVGVVTLVVGSLALYTYAKGRADNKKRAASIVLLEIKNAEAQFAQAKEIFLRDKVVPESIFTMKTANWSKYSYLFVGDLTDEEWRLINTFYEKSYQYDEIVEYHKTFFKKNEEQIRINLHQALAFYTRKLLGELSDALEQEMNDKAHEELNKKLLEKYNNLTEAFHAAFMGNLTSPNSNYLYNPQKTIDDIGPVINTVRLDLSTGTIGTKLEELRKGSWLYRWPKS